MTIPVRERRLKILVVDDEIDAVQLLTRILAKHFEILSATNGRDALVLLEANPDTAVIVSDQRMPGMTGVEFLRQTLAIAPNAVRVMVSGFTAPDELLDAINTANVRRYVVKPVQAERFITVVRQALEDYYFMEELRERLLEKP